MANQRFNFRSPWRGDLASEYHCGMDYHLRTLMILLAVASPIVAGDYWVWNAHTPMPSRYGIVDGGLGFAPNKPGYHWELRRASSNDSQAPLELREVPDESL